MKRKIFTLLMCTLLVAAFTACSDTDGSSVAPDAGSSSSASSIASPDASPAASPDASPDASPAASPEASGGLNSEGSEGSEGSDVGGMAAGSLDSYAKAVKDAYAGDYIPDRMLTDTEIEEKLGLTADMYEDIYAEGSTLDENPDIFVAVKAKSGMADEVEQKLKAYKDKLASDTAYSANVDKINAAEVYSNGDHVFLFLLGKNDFTEGIEDVAEGFASEVKKGVDAIKQLFS